MRLICVIIATWSICVSAQTMLPHRSAALTSSSSVDPTGGLVAYWRLDETTGTRVDSEPSGTAQDLTMGFTVPSATGIKTNAALFNGTTKYLFRSGTDAGPLNGGDRDWTWMTWVKTTTAAANGAVISKGGNNAYEYLIKITNSTGLRFSLVMNGTAVAGPYVGVDWSGTITDGVWYCVFAWFDASADLMFIQVNNGTPVSASNTLIPVSNTQIFFIGTDASNNFVNAAVDETGFWDRELTSGERSYLYNGGLGRTYSPINGFQ